MATVLGTSGAWRQVTRKLQSLGVRASHPREVHDELERQRASYDDQVAQLVVEVDREIADLEQQLLRVRAESESRIVTKCLSLETEISQIERHIAILKVDGGVLRGLLNKAKISIAGAKKKSLEGELNRFCSSVYEELANFQCRVERTKRNRERTVDERRRDLDHRITELRAVLLSGELAGAKAELEVIDTLSGLPAGCVVLSDVRLEADRFMRFAGQPLQSAQIDHAVLTPQGIFVIEVKNWSAEFVQSQTYFDPYTQVSRARFLCQTMLRDRGLACRVRGVIASLGKIPPKKPDQYVKVVALQDLVRYILWFKEPPLIDSELRAIRSFLEYRVSQ